MEIVLEQQKETQNEDIANLKNIEIPFLIQLSRPTIIKDSKAPFGFKEERKFKMIVSPEIVDLQEDLIQIDAIYKALDIWINERRGTIIDCHSNLPCGWAKSWGPFEYQTYKAALVEGEIFNTKYSNDDEVWYAMQSGDYNGNSIGGKIKAAIRKCDSDKCYNYITGLELYEVSIVPEGANQLAHNMLKSKGIRKDHPISRAITILNSILQDFISKDNNFLQVSTMPTDSNNKKKKTKESTSEDSQETDNKTTKEVPTTEQITPSGDTIQHPNSTELKEKPDDEKPGDADEEDDNTYHEEDEATSNKADCPCNGDADYGGAHKEGCPNAKKSNGTTEAEDNNDRVKEQQTAQKSLSSPDSISPQSIIGLQSSSAHSGFNVENYHIGSFNVSNLDGNNPNNNANWVPNSNINVQDLDPIKVAKRMGATPAQTQASKPAATSPNPITSTKAVHTSNGGCNCGEKYDQLEAKLENRFKGIESNMSMINTLASTMNDFLTKFNQPGLPNQESTFKIEDTTNANNKKTVTVKDVIQPKEETIQPANISNLQNSSLPQVETLKDSPYRREQYGKPLSNPDYYPNSFSSFNAGSQRPTLAAKVQPAQAMTLDPAKPNQAMPNPFSIDEINTLSKALPPEELMVEMTRRLRDYQQMQPQT